MLFLLHLEQLFLDTVHQHFPRRRHHTPVAIGPLLVVPLVVHTPVAQCPPLVFPLLVVLDHALEWFLPVTDSESRGGRIDVYYVDALEVIGVVVLRAVPDVHQPGDLVGLGVLREYVVGPRVEPTADHGVFHLVGLYLLTQLVVGVEQEDR